MPLVPTTRTSSYGEAALVVCAAIGCGAFAVPEFAGWPPTGAALAFCALTLANVLLALLSRPASGRADWTIVRPAFVVDFTALLLLGPRAGVIVCAAGIIVRLLSESPGRARASETLLPLAGPLLALEAAAFAHLALGGTIGTFEWPWQGAPIAVAVCAYCLVFSAVTEVAVPLFSGRPRSKSWPAVVLDGYPVYLTAAGFAVVAAELIERQLWAFAVKVTPKTQVSN